jgi:hypothetical protein
MSTTEKPAGDYLTNPTADDYRNYPVANIGAEFDPHENDELASYDVSDKVKQLPEPEAGTLEAKIVALRRATRDAGDLFGND